MRSNYKRIGDYIRIIKDKNNDGKLSELLGININKYFMPSVANVNGTDLKKYKIVKPKQFSCNRMHVGRDKKLPVALSNLSYSFIVSPAYDVFEIIDTNKLLPEYLMMWFSREEFDRNSWFYTDTDVRGRLGWDSFCDMTLPVPSIEKQQEIVDEYKVIINRIKLNEELNQKLEETAQAIYKEWFVDFEFPMTKEYAEAIGKPELEGKPYKSNGGELVYNEELENDIPVGWEEKNLGEISTISAGGDRPKIFSNFDNDGCTIPIYSNSMVNEGLFGYTDKARVFERSITISARGGIGFTSLRIKPYVPIVRLIVVITKYDYLFNYIYYCVSNFQYNDTASVQGQLTVPEISSYKIFLPNSEMLKFFQKLNDKFINYIAIQKLENRNLEVLRYLILSKMAKVGI